MSTPRFEGPEKKVELVVVPGTPPLRAQGRAVWEGVVEAAGAQVLSLRETPSFDAYLLSESSLFVYDNRFTLITCGQTRMADAVEAALGFIPPEAVAFLALERKNEHFPRDQPTTFEEDAARLNAVLPGAALRFGDEHSHCIQLFHTTRPYAPDPADTTLEVLMHGIVSTGSAFLGSAEEVCARAKELGLHELMPGHEVDPYAFTPGGFSLNAMRGNRYYTLHVTPEEVGSYVSFETNADLREPGVTQALVERVVKVFQPESFDVFTFVPGEAGPLDLDCPGYRLRKHASGRVGEFRVSFLYFFAPCDEPVAPFPLRLPLPV
ncbi:MAG: adenosylmethionine decarboxylase [Planctomycetes bacterium]|nr:adenosylmethionine decarboxylase [Planctomycetota bacterium]